MFVAVPTPVPTPATDPQDIQLIQDAQRSISQSPTSQMLPYLQALAQIFSSEDQFPTNAKYNLSSGETVTIVPIPMDSFR